MIDEKEISKIFPEEIVESNVSIKKENQFLDWERAGILFDNNLIPSQQGIYIEIIVNNNNYPEDIFNMEYAIFDNVGYINWTRIHEDYRRLKISSRIRRKVVNQLFSSGCSEIFTIPSSKAGEELIKSQEFNKTNIQPDNNSYTIYSRIK